MLLLKCCTQYISQIGKLSSGHRTGKGHFSFLSQRKAMPKNVQTTKQLCSFQMLISCVHVYSAMFDSLWPRGLKPARLPCPRKFPSKNTRVGCHFLLQEIFMTQKLNPQLLHLQHCKQILNQLCHLGSPHAIKVMLKILKTRLQQHMNRELSDVQPGFWRGRGTRDIIATINWIMEKAREFQKNIYFGFIYYDKVFVWITTNCKKF